MVHIRPFSAHLK